MLESTLSTVLTDLWLIVRIVGSLTILVICVRVLWGLLGGIHEDRRKNDDKE